MDRTDFIENRIDVIKNIYTLYSYAKSSNTEEKEWAIQRFKLGKWYVVEPLGNMLIFAPSRFVGYKNNTKEKHISNPGNGVETNDKIKELKLYQEANDDYISKEFELFMSTLGIEKDQGRFLIPMGYSINDLKQHHKCYFISPTHCKGQKEEAWKSFLSNNIMAIGWKHTDYSTYTIEQIKHEYHDDRTAIGAFTLIKQIKEGDTICCTNNNFGLWGIGIALSRYKYKKSIHCAGKDNDNSTSFYSHYIDVAWLCYKDRGYIPVSDFNIQFPEKVWPPYGTLHQKEELPLYISNYLLKTNQLTMEENNKYQEYIDLLKANKNLILTGAPGTGKTYIAQAIAKAMGAHYDFVQFHPSYDYTDFVEGLRPTAPDNNGNIGFKRTDGAFKAFCKKAINGSNALLQSDIPKYFKEGDIIPSSKGRSSYRIEGIKEAYIQISGDSIKPYSIPFNEICEAYQNKLWEGGQKNGFDAYSAALAKRIYEKKSPFGPMTEEEDNLYVFIIDEINRGEISKIFGELFFSIDPGFRGNSIKVKTQYQNLITDDTDPFYEGFYVPENIYIIGTMNDIDRSVESMDFAMRRRFAWKEVLAEKNTGMLDDLQDMKQDVVATMKRLNSAIWDEENNTGIEGLSKAYHIGGAYFSKLSLYLNNDKTNKDAAYKHLWENHLKGILSEYLRGTENAKEKLITLEQAYFNNDCGYDLEG